MPQRPFSSRWRCSAASRLTRAVACLAHDPGAGTATRRRRSRICDREAAGAVREVKAPSPPGLQRRVFLAGSIEMGEAEQWQKRIVAALSGAGDLVILNPRRDDWDGSWEQRADDPRFSEQVNW